MKWCWSCLAAVLWVNCAWAAPKHQFSSWLMYERWASNEIPGHGAVMLAYDRHGLPKGAHFSAEFNTDTLRFDYDRIRLSPRLQLGMRVTAEAFIANLLSEYYRGGENNLGRGVSASYGLAQLWLDHSPGHGVNFRFETGLRKWLFKRRDKTDPALILPADAWVVEPRIHFTLWRLAGDRGWRDRYRVYPHLRGWAFGLTLGMNWQHDTRAWGARDPEAFDPVDPRNEPEAFQFSVTQWMRAGRQISRSLRVEVVEEAGWRHGEDDLTRRPIGGMTPYSMNIPGVPWAYFHAGDYMGGQTSLHWAVAKGLEIGPAISLIALRDADRIGEDPFSFVWGVGGLLDWRLDNWQVDIRGGYSPGLKSLHPDQGAWTALVAVGFGTH